MNWVGKALTTVSSYYKEINPATLSGAIDVIVVESKNQETGQVQLACSPFHVRFGKLSVLRPVDRKVIVRVNDVEAPFLMKVGETGEAYFVFETESDDVPADLLTSPISHPVSDQDIPSAQEPDFLDLNASSPESSTEGPSSGSANPTSIGAEEDLGDPIRGTSSFLQNTAVRAAQVVLAPTALVTGLASRARNSRLSTSSSDSEAEQEAEEKPAGLDEIGELEKGMKDKLEGRGSMDSQRSDGELGDDVRQAARNSSEARANQSSISEDSNKDMEADLSKSTQHSRGSTLMLDMAGYKVEGDDTSIKGKELESTLLGREIKARTEDQGDEIVDFTQGLLRSADLHKSRNGASLLALAGESGLLNDIKDLSIHNSSNKQTSVPSKPSTVTGYSRPTSRANSPSPPPSITDSNQVGSIKASAEEYLFTLHSDDQEFVFELSLCGSAAFRNDHTLDARTFDAQRITFEQFRDQKELISDKNLVCRYKNRYLTWDNASPVLASLQIYHNALSPDDLRDEKDLFSTAEQRNQSRPDRPSPANNRTWSRWFTKPRSASTATTPTSPSAYLDHSFSVRGEDTLRSDKPPSTPRTRATSAPQAELPSTAPDPVEIKATPLKKEANTDVSTTKPVDSLPKHYAKTLRLTSDQLKRLNLQKGVNTISFSVSSSYSSSIVKCTSRVFLWEQDFQVVISDIDGTITKSDALGHVFTMIGRDWTHLGVAKLYTDIARNGYKMMYLTSRAIGQADTTREYLRGISQNGYTLPEGPVIMSPDRLMTSLHREVIMRKPEVFKMACLQDIDRLFAPEHPFYAGFGNRITDALSYRTVEVPSSRIFTIDSMGEVKMELLELAGYTSSYIAMNDLVDQMFPPINRHATPEYTDFNFWRAPMPLVDLPDLTPPSPTLSARSDSSRYSIRRLTSSIARRTSKSDLTSDRQRASSPRPTSPLSLPSNRVSEEVDDNFELGSAKSDTESEDRSSPRLRTESMPGSLEPDNDFDYYYRKHAAKQEKDGTSTIKQRPKSWGTSIDKEPGRIPWPSHTEMRPRDSPVNMEDLSDEEFPIGEMDFSSVPY